MLARHNAIAFALLCSLLLHLVVFWQWRVPEFSRAVAPVVRSLSFSFSQSTPPQVNVVPDAASTATSSDSGPRPSTDSPAASDQPVTTVNDSPELSPRQGLPSFGDLDLKPPPVGEVPTDGVPHLFDARLAAQIEAARARPRSRSLPAEEANSLADTTRTVGGRQVTLVRVGDLCFEVAAADPLDPLGREQWYRVSCRL